MPELIRDGYPRSSVQDHASRTRAPEQTQGGRSREERLHIERSSRALDHIHAIHDPAHLSSAEHSGREDVLYQIRH